MMEDITPCLTSTISYRRPVLAGPGVTALIDLEGTVRDISYGAITNNS